MVDVSLWTSLSTESHPNLCNNGAADESKGLPVTVIEKFSARFACRGPQFTVLPLGLEKLAAALHVP